MRQSESTTAINWRYAVGEVLLIVIGVSIALAANSWYENRQERAEERAILSQLREALDVDLLTFGEYQETHLQQEQDIIDLLEFMEGSEPYQPRLTPKFRSIRRWRGVEVNTAAYETLKSRGLQLISDGELRTRITFYYENVVVQLTDAASNDRDFVTGRLNPYTDTIFVSRDANTMIPLDFNALRNDIYYRNLILMKLFRLQSFILPNYQQATRLVRELIAAIEREIQE
jgi:hypothetical protein